MKSCAAGYTEWVLFHVWQKNKQTGTTCPGLLIPNTVIYRLGKPFFWYYTDTQGELLRKGKNLVNHKTILEEFHSPSTEIVASYIGFQSMTKARVSSATIEFFTQTSFQDFIQNPEKCKAGILQKWVHPRSESNSLIKVQWSSQFCLIEKRTNKFKLDDPKAGFYEKLVTYEGMEHNSSFEPVTAPWIISELQQVCVNISCHITAVTGGNVTVTRLILFFKHDSSDRLWFLYCSAIKILDLNEEEFDQPLEWEELEISVPKHIFKDKLPVNVKDSELKKNKKLCVGCNYLTRDSLMYEIALNVVVKFFVANVNLPIQGESVRDKGYVEEGYEELSNKVPKVMKRLNKGITNQKYKEMLKDPAWDHMQVKVCQDCFLHFTQVYANPEFYREQPVTTVKISEIQPEEPKKSQNPPLRINYPNVVENIKTFEQRKIQTKVSVKTKDFIRHKPAKITQKIEVKENEEKKDLKFLPPIRGKSIRSVKESRSQKILEIPEVKNEIRDNTSNAYRVFTALPPSQSKKGIKIKDFTPSAVSYSLTPHDPLSKSSFIQDTLALLKSTISQLPEKHS